MKQIVPEEREFLVPEKLVILMNWGELGDQCGQGKMIETDGKTKLKI